MTDEHYRLYIDVSADHPAGSGKHMKTYDLCCLDSAKYPIFVNKLLLIDILRDRESIKSELDNYRRNYKAEQAKGMWRGFLSGSVIGLVLGAMAGVLMFVL